MRQICPRRDGRPRPSSGAKLRVGGHADCKIAPNRRVVRVIEIYHQLSFGAFQRLSIETKSRESLLQFFTILCVVFNRGPQSQGVDDA